MGVDECQNDVSGLVIDIIVFGLSAVIASEATVEHGKVVLLGL